MFLKQDVKFVKVEFLGHFLIEKSVFLFWYFFALAKKAGVKSFRLAIDSFNNVRHFQSCCFVKFPVF